MSNNPLHNTRLLRLEEVKKVTGLSRSTLYAYIKTGDFPPPLQVGSRAVGWLENEITAWIGQKIESRGGVK